MKRVGIIVAFIAFLILVAAISVRVYNARPTLGWRAFEQQFPDILQQAGVRALESDTGGSQQVTLPIALRIRQSLAPRPQTVVVSGFPEAVEHFTLESVENRCRMECLVRYSRGMVARVILRYPPAARIEAAKLGAGLRQLSDSILVSLYENTGS